MVRDTLETLHERLTHAHALSVAERALMRLDLGRPYSLLD